MTKTAPIVKAARQTVDGAIKEVKGIFRATTTAAADAKPKTGMSTATKEKIVAAGGIPIAAGVGVGVGSYVGLKGVSSGIKDIASGGKSGVTSLAIGLVVLIVLIAVISFAYIKVKQA
jgi:hypothetical protein